MLKYKLLILFFVIFYHTVIFTQEKKVNYILSPLMTYPAIVEKGEMFDCEIDLSSFSYEKNILVSFSLQDIKDEGKLYSLSIKKKSYNKNNKLAYYKVFLPKEIEDGLYNLYLDIKTEKGAYWDIQYKSVKVISKYPEKFTFIVAPDIHLAKVSTLFGEQNYNKVVFAFDEISKKNPEFVLIPGDVVNGVNYKREYEDVWNFFKTLDIPIYVVPGNHDSLVIVSKSRGEVVQQDGIEYWRNFFGKRFFSFVFGKFYFIGIDTFCWDKEKRKSPMLSIGAISKEHLLWIESELKKARRKNKEVIIFGHHPVHSDNSAEPDMSDIGKKEFLELCRKYKVKAVISGHTHWDSLDVVNGVYFIGVTTPSAKLYQNGYHGFREIEIKEKEIVKINYRDPQFEEYNKLKGVWSPTFYVEKKWSTPLYFQE